MSGNGMGDACQSEELEELEAATSASSDAPDPTLTVGAVHSSGRVSVPGKPAAESRASGTHRIFAQDELIAFRYRIVRAIAQGGMGEVYEAEDLELRQRIALKVVRRERALHEGGFEQLKREMYLARKVTHPNVCRIFDVGFHMPQGTSKAGRIPFITMELIEGETLADRLRRTGPLPLEEALPCIRQMIDALGAAHAVGIVHRDFKSGNVFLGPRVVVADFGLATRSRDARHASTPLESPEGTPGYMAPEQLDGGRITPATDIYALGVVICEMLTGVRPRGPVGVPGFGPAWEALLSHCLAQDPEHRFSSVHAIARALPGEVPRPHTGQKSPMHYVRTWASISALMACAFLGGRLARMQLAPSEAPASLPPPMAMPAPTSRPLQADAARWYGEGLLELRHLEPLAARDRFERVVGLEPGYALGHTQLAEAYRQLGNGPRALEAAKRAFALTNDEPVSREEALLIEGRYREAAGQWEAAVRVFRTLFEFFPRQLEYGIALARNLQGAGNPREAFATLAKLRASTDPSAALDIDEAESEIAERETDLPRAQTAALRAADTAQRREAWSRAAANYNAARSALTLLGKTMEAEDSRQKAVALYERAGDASSRASASYLAGQEREEAGDLDAAAEIYRAALDAYRELGDLRALGHVAYSLARISLRAGKASDALGFAQESTGLAREIGDHALQRTRLVFVMAAYLHLGDLEALSAAAREARALAMEQHDEENLAIAMCFEAEVLRLRGERGNAASLLTPALEIARRSAVWTLNLLEVAHVRWLLDDGRPHEALRIATELRARIPRLQVAEVAWAELLRARSLLAMGDMASARAAFDRSNDVRTSALSVEIRWEQRIVEASLLVAEQPERAEQALVTLKTLVGMAHAFGYYTMELEARFAAGEIEMTSGRTAEGRARLRALADEAKARGFLLWGRKAEATAGTSPARSRSGPSSDAPAHATSPGLPPRG
ncbi:protein kinase [Pendulispora rubella]|uniref:Protein kinase n=1 Tax=Pendulispora rubella TaxID=2741070 RepID=A0ABZ2LCA2_9BACT